MEHEDGMLVFNQRDTRLLGYESERPDSDAQLVLDSISQRVADLQAQLNPEDAMSPFHAHKSQHRERQSDIQYLIDQQQKLKGVLMGEELAGKFQEFLNGQQN